MAVPHRNPESQSKWDGGAPSCYVCKCMSAAPEGRWWEAFPDIARGFRQLPLRGTGLSPFLLQFKQFLELAPDQGPLQDVEENTDLDQAARDVDDTLAYWQHVF